MMGIEGLGFDEIEGSALVRGGLYRRYQEGAERGRSELAQLLRGAGDRDTGPSWGRANWPPVETDALTAALDPTQMQPAPKPARGGAPAQAAAPRRRRAGPKAVRRRWAIRSAR
jgi:2-oxoglutarate dehydrogenase E1 component